jgi:hypothetical protein
MGSKADLCFELSGLQLTGPDMLVDEYEQYNNDRPDVIDISPDGTSEEPAEVEPMADDCMCDDISSSASFYNELSSQPSVFSFNVRSFRHIRHMLVCNSYTSFAIFYLQ